MNANVRARAAIMQCVEYVAGSDAITAAEAAEWIAGQPGVVRGLARDFLEDSDTTDGGPVSPGYLRVFEDWVISILRVIQRDGTE